MGNILKIKIALIIFSLAMLILIPLVETNFYAPVTYKKWQPLTWDDFQGLAKPFTGWGAGISSTVNVEWDSAANKYTAYATQNNQRSWRRKNLNNPEYGLNHEQYHFNITEIHARIMRQYLDSIQKTGNTNFKDRLLTLTFQLRTMQDSYDDESDHSLNLGMQRRWEYKIDSMLQLHSKGINTVTDYYSGAQVFFPVMPLLSTNQNQGKYVSRLFYVSGYSMFLVLSSSRFYEAEIPLLNDRIAAFYENQSIEIVSMETIDSDYAFKKIVSGKDTLMNTTLDMWIYENENLYKLTTFHIPCDVDEEIGFRQITDSFFNSFQILDIEEYWFSNLDTMNLGLSGFLEKVTTIELNSGMCTVDNPPDQFGFTAGPFFKDSVGLLLVVDYGKLTGSIHQTMVRIGNNITLFEPKEKDQIYFIPSDKLPLKPFLLEYGILQKDSTQDCFQFKYQERWVDLRNEFL